MNLRLLVPMLLITGVTGCGPDKMHRKPLETVGERTNEQGLLRQRIVREISYTTKDVLLTPEGPRKKIDYDVRYFLEEPGKPRRELSIMRSADFSKYGGYFPVDNTSFWVGTGIDPVGNKDKLYLVLFDESRIVHERTFTVLPKWQSDKAEYEFQDGNHTMLFQSPVGLKRYDVLADTTD